QVIRAIGDQPITITRIDSLVMNPAPGKYELCYFTSDWGQEFEPVRLPLTGEITLETHAGRSSKGMHPWFALSATKLGLSVAVALAWSGNWIFRFEPLANSGYHFSGGLNDWEFSKTLQAGEVMESPHVLWAFDNALSNLSRRYAATGCNNWYPRNALSDL